MKIEGYMTTLSTKLIIGTKSKFKVNQNIDTPLFRCSLLTNSPIGLFAIIDEVKFDNVIITLASFDAMIRIKDVDDDGNAILKHSMPLGASVKYNINIKGRYTGKVPFNVVVGSEYLFTMCIMGYK